VWRSDADSYAPGGRKEEKEVRECDPVQEHRRMTALSNSEEHNNPSFSTPFEISGFLESATTYEQPWSSASCFSLTRSRENDYGLDLSLKKIGEKGSRY